MESALKQILVHADGTEHCGARLEVAFRLASAHGAKVRVLYAASPAEVTVPTDGLSMDLAVRVHDMDERRRAQARLAYDRAREAVDVDTSWDELDLTQTVPGFVQQAWFADLMVLGQHDRSRPQAAHVRPDYVETLVEASGKPALVLPYAGRVERLGSKVVIAWKASREAARAVAASLPLLKQAQSVHVLTWAAQSDAPGREPGMDLAGYLRSHGVNAQWQWEGPERAGVGEMLLSRCFDMQADLLVMGCYSHSRAREWLLGGASRTLLASMTLPVLMAH